jgi:3',5'-cyclic-AMP phosphodiesterase
LNFHGKHTGVLRSLAFFGLALLGSCGPFEYSPHAVPVPGSGAGLNSEQLERIRKISPASARGFRFAVMADTHLAYDDLIDAIDHINADSSLDFTLIAGDVTYYGYLKEYEWFAEIIARFASPYLVGVGNHDLQANGASIFKSMFGAVDFSFVHKGVRFVFFDDNTREYACCKPDFEWLAEEIAGAGDSLMVFTVSHSPPSGDQLDSATGEYLARTLARSGVDLSIHGHQHNYHYREFYGDGVMYLVADNIQDRNYAVVTVEDGNWSVERKFF